MNSKANLTYRGSLILASILFCVICIGHGCTGDDNKTVSGAKFAISDISPGLPSDWEEYNYVVLEMKSSTSQRFHVGFTTETGYNELRVMSYVANGWIKLAIPLRFYTQLPDAASDLAGTYNQPRYTGWINLTGKRGPMKGIDSIGIRMHLPIGNPTIELRSINLSVEDPGDEYLGDIPVVDEFGQWNLGNFDGKAGSLEQLKQEWENESKELAQPPVIKYSKYGGFADTKIEGTGYFRTGQIEGKWWFVDPEGHLFLSLGADCVGSGQGGAINHIDKRENFYKELPPEGVGWNPRRPNSASIGRWNLYRRFGEEYREKSNDMIINRMEMWGINTIANWSDRRVINLNRKAFMLQLYNLGIDEGFMGLPDVYSSDFETKIDEACKEFVVPYKDNPYLIGYFVANEPAWVGQESRICDMIINGGEDTPIMKILTNYLGEGDTPERRVEFIYNTFRIFLETVNNSVKKYDPNHLNLGIRFGHIPGNSMLEICKDVFDVFSFNCYDVSPGMEMMDRCLEVTGLPMIIGEYHFGTIDRGMAQALIQVESQEERGIAYRYYTENAFAHPGLIGVAWFQWADQDLLGRGYDGENYNCGLVDVTDRPYKHMVAAIMESAQQFHDIHKGLAEPFNRKPKNPGNHGPIPDIWNK